MRPALAGWLVATVVAVASTAPDSTLTIVVAAAAGVGTVAALWMLQRFLQG